MNFSKECKIQLIRQCCDAIRNVAAERSDTYPLRAYRLMIILDYMLKAFSVVPHKLFEQVQGFASPFLAYTETRICVYLS